MPERCAAEAAQQRLLQLGVAVGWDGSVALTPQLAASYSATPWVKDFDAAALTRALPRRRDVAPSRVQLGDFDRFLSRVCRAVEAAAAADLWRRMDDAGKANLLTSGGQGTGSLWSRVGRSPHEMIPNAHWRQAVSSRLDVRPIFGGRRCQLRRAEDPEGQCCAAVLSQHPRHTELCKRGAVRQRAHRNLAAAVATAATQLGMHADLERFVPELYKQLPGTPPVPADADVDGKDSRVKKAILDVVLSCPGFESLLLLDVSIRSAAAARYSAATCAGHAAESGERDKMSRYGSAVMPLIFESGGRLGPASIATLSSIVSKAAAARLCSSHSISSWRSRTERSVIFSVAEAAIRAYGAA